MKKLLALVATVLVLLFSIAGSQTVEETKASAPNRLGVKLQLSSNSIYLQHLQDVDIALHVTLENPYSTYYVITLAYDITVYLDGQPIRGTYPSTKAITEWLDWDLALPSLTGVSSGSHTLSVYVAAKYQYKGSGLPNWYPTFLADGSGTSNPVSFTIIDPLPSTSFSSSVAPISSPTTLSSQSASPTQTNTSIPTPPNPVSSSTVSQPFPSTPPVPSESPTQQPFSSPTNTQSPCPTPTVTFSPSLTQQPTTEPAQSASPTQNTQTGDFIPITIAVGLAAATVAAVVSVAYLRWVPNRRRTPIRPNQHFSKC